MLEVKIITLFPELFPGSLGCSIMGEALKKNIWSLEVFNLRDYATNKHKKVDDEPYGGGSGMVIQAEVIEQAILAASNNKAEDYQIFYPSPRGTLLNQKKIVEFAKNDRMMFVPGRYEGLDQRIIDKYNFHEFSIGDYILSGGEIAVQVMLDAVLRQLPGVLGNSSSLAEESFTPDSAYANLLEYPHYTRPELWQGVKVPEILRSGNHQKIAEWRLEQAKKITRERRPDLWQKYKENN